MIDWALSLSGDDFLDLSIILDLENQGTYQDFVSTTVQRYCHILLRQTI